MSGKLFERDVFTMIHAGQLLCTWCLQAQIVALRSRLRLFAALPRKM